MRNAIYTLILFLIVALFTGCKKNDTDSSIIPTVPKASPALRDSLRYVAAFAFKLDSADYKKLPEPGVDKPGLKLEENMENADVAFILKAVMSRDTTQRTDKIANYVVISSSRSVGNGVQYNYMIYKGLATGDNTLIVTKYLSLNYVAVSQYLFIKKK